MRTRVAQVVVLLIVSQLLSGCTVIGFTTGERLDMGRFRSLGDAEVARHVLKVGDEVRVSESSGRWKVHRFIAWTDTLNVLDRYMVVKELSRTNVFYEPSLLDSIRVSDIEEVELREPPLYGPSLGALGMALDLFVVWSFRDLRLGG